MTILFFYPGKANVVANALNRKSAGSLAHINTERRLINKSCKLIDQGLQLNVTKKCILSRFRVRSVYVDRVKQLSQEILSSRRSGLKYNKVSLKIL